MRAVSLCIGKYTDQGSSYAAVLVLFAGALPFADVEAIAMERRD